MDPKKMFITVFSLGLCLLLQTKLYAKEVSTSELEEIQKKLKSFETLTIDFTQSKFVKLRPKQSNSLTGKAFLSKPDMFRWILNRSGGTQEWIYDGKSLINYSSDRGDQVSAIRYPSSTTLVQEIREIIDIFLNINALLKKYNVLKSNFENDLLSLKLKPKQEFDIVEIDVELNVKQNVIKTIVLYFKNGNRSTFAFTNPSNSPLKPGAFSLPPSVKIKDALK